MLIIFAFNINNFSRACLWKRTTIFLSVTNMVISITCHGVIATTDWYPIRIVRFTSFRFNRFSSFIMINQRNDILLLKKPINSISIELLQLLLRLGTFQLLDIFYNTVGGVIGGLVHHVAIESRKRQKNG